MSLPFVPYRAFCVLAGSDLATEADRMLAQPGLMGLVLFADTEGRRGALAPVGPDQWFESFAAAEGGERDGMRAACALRLADVREGEERLRREKTLDEREAALAARERRVAEAEKRLGEIARTLAEREVFGGRRDSAAPLPPPAA